MKWPGRPAPAAPVDSGATLNGLPPGWPKRLSAASMSEKGS
jgi:hypothetical protein